MSFEKLFQMKSGACRKEQNQGQTKSPPSHPKTGFVFSSTPRAIFLDNIF